MNEIRISAEHFKGKWTVNIGMYRPNPVNYYYSLRLVESDSFRTLPESLADAKDKWRRWRADWRWEQEQYR